VTAKENSSALGRLSTYIESLYRSQEIREDYGQEYETVRATKVTTTTKAQAGYSPNQHYNNRIYRDPQPSGYYVPYVAIIDNEPDQTPEHPSYWQAKTSSTSHHTFALSSAAKRRSTGTRNTSIGATTCAHAM
jgi:hypothetical protein